MFYAGIYSSLILNLTFNNFLKKVDSLVNERFKVTVYSVVTCVEETLCIVILRLWSLFFLKHFRDGSEKSKFIEFLIGETREGWKWLLVL